MNRLTRNSWLTSAVILVIGFLFLHFGLVDYGGTFFILFPLAVGFSIGTHARRERGVISLVLALVIFFGFLLASALEGLICVAMALPIFLISMLIGYGIRRAVLKRKGAMRKPLDATDHFIPKDRIIATVLPLVLLMVINPVEQMLLPEPALVEIETSVLLPYAADLVFDQVKSMDKLDAEKPLGIWLGLPAPYRCVLAADTVGARRHCLFTNGEIVAEITRYEHGEVLEMDVVDYTLTGRDWFQFVDATYTFDREAGQTRITRTSSYKSILQPRFYWEPLERWGIAQEHEFVLASLRKNLGEVSGRH